MISSTVVSISNYSPNKIVLNNEIENLINSEKRMVPDGILKEKFGMVERRFAADNEQASDLAVKAALKILTDHHRNTIDCIIFAAGSRDRKSVV